MIYRLYIEEIQNIRLQIDWNYYCKKPSLSKSDCPRDNQQISNVPYTQAIKSLMHLILCIKLRHKFLNWS